MTPCPLLLSHSDIHHIRETTDALTIISLSVSVSLHTRLKVLLFQVCGGERQTSGAESALPVS